MQLARKRIIAAAIELIEADGVEAISMQRLATELGCGLMSLYNYVPSRNALLDGVADEIMSGVAWTYMPGASSQDQMRALGGALRQIASAHPRCAMLAASRRGGSLLRPAETMLATLQGAGFSGPDAVRIVRAFATYILGLLVCEVGVAPDDGDSAVSRLRPAQFPQLAELRLDLRASDVEGDLEFALDLLARATTASAS
jgi:AcrR family transcriptional regulator